MAYIFGGPIWDTDVVWPPSAYCYVKADWTDDWQYAPYLWPNYCTHVCAPSISEAEFEYSYGYIAHPNSAVYYTWSPASIGGYYIGIQHVDFYGSYLSWCGRIERDQYVVEGSYNGFPSGEQTLRAYGPESILAGLAVSGSWAYCSDPPVGGSVSHIDRPMTFNKRAHIGIGVDGNRSASIDGTSGEYYFYEGEDAYAWSALAAAAHILAYYGNNLGNGGRSGPLFCFTNSALALDTIYNEWDLAGKSVLGALNELVDRRRGLTYRVLTTGSGTVWLDVVSTYAFDMALPDGTYLYGNYEQIVPDLSSDIRIKPTLTFDRTTWYDYIQVTGGPLCICGTFYVANSTLTPYWTAALEAAYITGEGSTTEEKDLSRGAEKYDAVYQYFKGTPLLGYVLPYSTDNFNCSPYVLWDGTLDYTTAMPQSNKRKWRREIPYRQAIGVTEYSDEYRKAFVLVGIDQGGGNGYLYQYVDKLKLVAKEPASVTLSDTDLGVWIRPNANHIAGDGSFNGDSDTDPQYNYGTYILTAMFETDTNVRIILPVLAPQGHEVVKVKYINDPSSEVWCVAPETILDVNVSGWTPGLPATGLTFSASTPTLARDDTSRMLSKAIMAQAWYSQQRCTMSMDMEGLCEGYWPGIIVMGVVDGTGYTGIGTMITSRRFDYKNNSTSMQTTFEELQV